MNVVLFSLDRVKCLKGAETPTKGRGYFEGSVFRGLERTGRPLPYYTGGLMMCLRIKTCSVRYRYLRHLETVNWKTSSVVTENYLFKYL